MLYVIISWLLLLIIFLSFGDMTITLWSYITHKNVRYSIFDKFFIGICSLGTILLYLSIFFPLNIWILGTILLAAFGYWAFNIKRIKSLIIEISNVFRQSSLGWRISFILAFICILAFSLCMPLTYDVGLYHTQSMMWTEKYPAILGLGNLHGRLGFNSSFLLLSAVFNYHPEIYEPLLTINSLAIFMFCCWLITNMSKNSYTAKNLCFVFILLTTVFVFSSDISSSSTDILANLLVLYILINLVIESNTWLKNILAPALLTIFCVTLKLSSAIILLILPLLISYLMKRGSRKTVYLILLIGFIVAIPWLGRFIILTGYLVYPISEIDIFSFDWKIPVNQVVLEKNLAFAWARNPNMDVNDVLSMPFFQWFPIWIKNLSFFRKGIYCLALISPLCLLRCQYITNKRNILLWAIAYLGTIYGLITAPDLRFTFGFVIAAIVIPILISLDGILVDEKNSLNKFVSYLLVVLLIYLTTVAYSVVNHYLPDSTRRYMSIIYKPQSLIDAKESKNIHFNKFELRDYTIFVPIENNQCYDQSLPCAPYYNSNLELRGKDIKHGFRIKNK